MSQVRGSVIGTATLLLVGAFINALIVATARTPPPWGWARLVMAFVMSVAAIRLLVQELRAGQPIDGVENPDAGS